MLTEKKDAGISLLIVNALPAHIADLKSRLRQEDENEILRFGASIQYALWRSYRQSIMKKSAFIDGKIAAAWGVCGTFMSDVGQPWLLTTEEVRKISPLKFCRIYQQEVAEMLKLFPKLVNYVDDAYTSAIRLLDVVGFTIGEPEPMGKNNALYRKFEIG